MTWKSSKGKTEVLFLGIFFFIKMGSIFLFKKCSFVYSPAFFQSSSTAATWEMSYFILYNSYVILPLSLRWIDFIYEVYDFKYLMLYEVTCFEGINEVKILLSEHILGWGQRTSEWPPHSSYILPKANGPLPWLGYQHLLNLTV